MKVCCKYCFGNLNKLNHIELSLSLIQYSFKLFFLPSHTIFLIFSCLVVSDSLQPRGLQHARLPCPSPSPGACSNSGSLCPWCIQPSHPLSPPFLPAFNVSQHQGIFFFSASQLCGQSIETSASASVLPVNIQDWLVGSPCSTRDSQECSLAPQFKSINSSVLSFLYGPTLTSILDYWKHHSFDYTDLCQQNDVSAF